MKIFYSLSLLLLLYFASDLIDENNRTTSAGSFCLTCQCLMNFSFKFHPTIFPQAFMSCCALHIRRLILRSLIFETPNPKIL